MLKTNYSVHFNSGTGSTASFPFEIPEMCPHCGKIMSPRFFYAVSQAYNYQESDDTDTVAVLLQCVLCYKFFTRMFLLREYNEHDYLKEISLTYTPPISTNIPENIIEISSRFPEIYNQALQAKQYGLKEIYGMGLRKALEFLVKDFAIHLNPDIESKIKKQQLGQVINENFNAFPNIKDLFTAAAWIGNDETHYERKHPDKDAETIQKFITTIMFQISSQLTYEEALQIVNGETSKD